MTLIQRASEFAAHAHGSIDHRRKYTGEPYIVHPAEVAELVASVGGTEEMIAAAWLHDVVEDTGTTINTIFTLFGPTVAQYVEGLTDVSKPEDGNRKIRKQKDLEHTAQQDPDVKTIKLADLISNSRSILLSDHPEARAFAKLYAKEKAQLLEVLTEGDQTLLAHARALVSSYYAKTTPVS